MAEQGILSRSEMPPFSVMGLLMGGRGYASGWFQRRDQLMLADAAIAKDRADRAAFAEGVMADPRYKNWLKNPNDRAAAGSLWALTYGGPESAANMGNSLFTQGIGAIQSQELAAQQNQYQLGQQQQAHGFNLAEQQNASLLNRQETDIRQKQAYELQMLQQQNASQLNRQETDIRQKQAHEFQLLQQTHGADEALRQAQTLKQQELDRMKQAFDFISKPLPDGWTLEQKQYALNQGGDMAGYKRKDGFDYVAGPDGGIIGQVPQRGTPERSKIEMTGNAYSNIQSLAAKHLWQLENGQVGSVAEWNAEVNSAMGDFRRIYEAGAMQEADKEFYETLLPDLHITETLTPDILGKKKEMLRALQERAARDLDQYAASTLVPTSTYTADDWQIPKNFQPDQPPSQEKFNAARDKREQRLKELPARNERRVRPPIEYTRPEGQGTFTTKPGKTFTRGGVEVK